MTELDPNDSKPGFLHDAPSRWDDADRLSDDEVRRLLALAETPLNEYWAPISLEVDLLGAAREAVPALCREVLAQRAEILRLRETIADATSHEKLDVIRLLLEHDYESAAAFLTAEISAGRPPS